MSLLLKSEILYRNLFPLLYITAFLITLCPHSSNNHINHWQWRWAGKIKAWSRKTGWTSWLTFWMSWIVNWYWSKLMQYHVQVFHTSALAPIGWTTDITTSIYCWLSRTNCWVLSMFWTHSVVTVVAVSHVFVVLLAPPTTAFPFLLSGPFQGQVIFGNIIIALCVQILEICMHHYHSSVHDQYPNTMTVK